MRAAFWLWLLTAVEVFSGDDIIFKTAAGKVLGQRDFSKWYQNRMKQAGIGHWRSYNTHSFRIGGATVLCAASCSIEQIKAMGRWESDVAGIYMRNTATSAINLGRQLDCFDARPIEDQDDAYFDRAAGISEDDAEILAQALAEEAEPFRE